MYYRYIHPNDVSAAFETLARARATRLLIQQFGALDDFIDYVRETYIRDNCPFPIPLWNVFERDINNRTNNNVECNNFLFLFFVFIY